MYSKADFHRFLLVPVMAVIALVGLLPSSGLGQVMTLDDAVRLGLKNNYDIQIARNSARVSQNNKGLGTAGLLPGLDASGNYQMTDTDEESNSPNSVGDNQVDSWNGRVSFNWTLFDGFKMFANRGRYNELAKLGEFQARNTIENTVVSITTAYLNLVQQEQLLEVAVETRDISKARLEKEQVRHDLGGASSTDLLNAQVAYNNDLSNLLNQQLQVTITREQLNVLLGRDPSTPIEVTRTIEVVPLSMSYDELIGAARQRNSSLLLAIQNARVAERDRQVQRGSFLPRLALTGSYGYTDRTTSADSYTLDISSQTTDATVGLALSFNLFNGGRDRIAYQNAVIESKNRHLALKDQYNRLEGRARERYDTFVKRMEIMRLEQQNVQAAAQNLELQQDRYRIGASGSLEFRDAQVNLATAQNRLIAARYQARISQLELEQLTGSISIE